MIRQLKHLRALALLCGTLIGSSSIAFAQWPEGPGKDLTLQLCGNCHDAAIVQAHRQSRDEWIATIQKMMAVGAEGTQEQFTAVLEYLAKNFGPAAAHINVNQASAAELVSELGLSVMEAAAFVKY